MVKSKKQMYIVVGAFALVLMLFTTTYAFFNYTRTGVANIIRTGRIYFNSEQDTSISLNNLFPIDPTEQGIMDDTTKVGTVTINVVGDTTYGEGIEYLVSAVDVDNGIGNKHLPMSINVSVANNTGNTPATTLGTASNDYFEDRGSTTSYYKVLANDVIHNNDQLVVGYIAPGATGVDGNIVIKAYIDKNKLAISDTYTEGDRYAVLTGLSNETIATCVSHLESIDYDDHLLTGETLSDFCAGTGTIDGKTFQETLDRGAFDSPSLTFFVNNNIIRYLGSDGTTDGWVDERTVFTTSEWNSLQSSGVSFKVKVEANEGTWVEAPLPDTIESCSGCVYTYTTEYLYYGNDGTVLQEGEYSTDYRTVITNERKNFYGVILDGTGMITRAFACGIKGSVPYCIEGTTNGSAYNDNKTLLQGASLWNGTCTPDYLNSVEYRISCGDPEEAFTRNDGLVMTYTGDYYCRVDIDSAMDCGED